MSASICSVFKCFHDLFCVKSIATTQRKSRLTFARPSIHSYAIKYYKYTIRTSTRFGTAMRKEHLLMICIERISSITCWLSGWTNTHTKVIIIPEWLYLMCWLFPRYVARQKCGYWNNKIQTKRLKLFANKWILNTPTQQLVPFSRDCLLTKKPDRRP